MSETGENATEKVSPGLSPEWDKTVLAIERVKEKGSYEEPDRESKRGYYLGRPIIGRDTPINGGVYLGGGEREAVVVDDSREDSPLHDVYKELLRTRSGVIKSGRSFRGEALSHVFDLVTKELPYNVKRVQKMGRKYGIKPDQKVSLDIYLKEKAGVCRHRALLAAYLLERMKKEGIIRGTASVDRNYVPTRGGHAWVRYINSAGIVFIIDPTNDLINEISNIKPELRSFYERPGNFFSRLTRR
jgi:hypothetical protein